MVLDVFDGVFAWGVLLVPAAALLATDSDWPVVVCQHGLEGLPSDTIGEEGSEANYDAYKAFTRRLAERGFVTFAPHNPCESPHSQSPCATAPTFAMTDGCWSGHAKSHPRTGHAAAVSHHD